MLDLTQLKRHPDVEAENLYAVDAADKLILHEAHSYLTEHIDLKENSGGEVVVIGDRYGALTLTVIHDYQLKGVRVFQDSIVHERALNCNAETYSVTGMYKNFALGEQLLSGAKTVLLRLPKSLQELEEVAALINRYAAKDVRVIAGGRVKHMTLQMNTVLLKYFERLDVSHAKQKARVLITTGIKKVVAPVTEFPLWNKPAELPFKLAAFGGTFGGTKYDHGTKLLLEALAPELKRLRAAKKSGPLNIVDLGCGNGTVATWVGVNDVNAKIIATDVSHAALKAARVTAEAAGVAERIKFYRADGLEKVPAAWADLIIVNPPFHTGTEIDETLAVRMLSDAAAKLSESGELWLVMNSHLKYRAMLARAVGKTTQVTKDRRFTVLKAQHESR